MVCSEASSCNPSVEKGTRSALARKLPAVLRPPSHPSQHTGTVKHSIALPALCQRNLFDWLVMSCIAIGRRIEPSTGRAVRIPGGQLAARPELVIRTSRRAFFLVRRSDARFFIPKTGWGRGRWRNPPPGRPRRRPFALLGTRPNRISTLQGPGTPPCWRLSKATGTAADDMDDGIGSRRRFWALGFGMLDGRQGARQTVVTVQFTAKVVGCSSWRAGRGQARMRSHPDVTWFGRPARMV